MSMKLGERLRVTLFGESHGRCVGALLEGLPAGTPIDNEALLDFINSFISLCFSISTFPRHIVNPKI